MPFSRQVAKRRLLLHKCMCNNTTLERAREDLKAKSSSLLLLLERSWGQSERGLAASITLGYDLAAGSVLGLVSLSTGKPVRLSQRVAGSTRKKAREGRQSGSLQRLSVETVGRARPHLRMPSGGQTDQRRARARAYEPHQGGRQGLHAVPGRQAALATSSG